MEFSTNTMPPIPEPVATAKELSQRLDTITGIYFAWKGGRVEYVGKSVDIFGRLRNHATVVGSDSISFIPFSPAEIHHAECYYIWLCRPVRNHETKLADGTHRRPRKKVDSCTKDDPTTTLMTQSQLANRLGITTRSVRRQVAEGRIGPLANGPGFPRYLRFEVEKWIECGKPGRDVWREYRKTLIDEVGNVHRSA